MTPQRQRPQCYAEFLRTSPPKQLFPAEVKSLRREQEWAIENPAKVKRLDAYVNRTFRFNDRTVDVITRWKDFLIVYDFMEGLHLCATPEQFDEEIKLTHASSKQG